MRRQDRRRTALRYLECLSFVLLAGCSEPTTPPGGGAQPSTPAIAGGMVHTCVLDASGAVTCWGRWGSVPNQQTVATPPTLVTPRDGSLRFASISAGSATCGLTHDGEAFCWGQNLYGELGDGTTTPRSQPTPVATTLRFNSIAVGTYGTCALSRDGRAYCWGMADYGGLGNGIIAEGRKELRPVPVAGNATFDSLTGGSVFCALTVASGQTVCWGMVAGSFDEKWYREPGDCRLMFYQAFEGIGCSVPTPLSGGRRFTSLATGAGVPTRCAVSETGAAYCWGEGWMGTLGNGQAGEGTHAVAPAAVVGGLAFRSIAVGASHVCGLASDGAAHCWGNNFRGYLGNGETAQPGGGIPGSAVPVRVSGGHQFVTLATGAYHTCGIAVGSAVWCWGAGTEGQLGGAANDSAIPVRVSLP